MSQTSKRIPRLVLTGIFAFAVASQVIAETPRQFSVPAGDLLAALDVLAKQADVGLVYRRDQLKGMQTQGVKATLTTQEAVKKVLEGTTLKLSTDEKTGAMLIAPAVNSSASGAASDQMRLATVEDEKSKSRNQAQDEAEDARQLVVKDKKIRPYQDLNADIPRTINDPQPYYVFDSETIERSSATTLEEFLKRRLTMNTVSQTRNQIDGLWSSSEGAASTINLRGFGKDHTLILVDGRRTANLASPIFGGVATQPDVNGLPLSAIERIEVLPTGASAIYGASAVGGVVNIILKKDFQGGEVRVSYDTPVDVQAPSIVYEGGYGFSLEGGRTRARVTAGYNEGDALLLGERLELVGRGLATILRNNPNVLYLDYSPFTGATTNIGLRPGYGYSSLTLKDGTSLNSTVTHIPIGMANPDDLRAGLISGAGSYNFEPSPGREPWGLHNEIGSVPRHKSLMLSVQREMTQSLMAFIELSTGSNVAVSNYGGTLSGRVNLDASSPHNPFQSPIWVSFPLNYDAPATSSNVTQRATVGLQIKLAGDWNALVDVGASRSLLDTSGLQSDPQYYRDDVQAGVINPFGNTLAYSRELDKYFDERKYSSTAFSSIVTARASGSLSLPWVRPAFTLKFEHRKETSEAKQIYLSHPDSTSPYSFSVGDGTFTTYFGQTQSVDSGYAEVMIPLLRGGLKLPLLKNLDVQLAVGSERVTNLIGTPSYVEYILYDGTRLPGGSYGSPNLNGEPIQNSVIYASTNPTFGLRYIPFEGVMLRASYATSFIPPSHSQLLRNPTGSPSWIMDPVTNSFGQAIITQGGNPDLVPQTTNSMDFGIVWQPEVGALKGMRLNLQYSSARERNVISGAPGGAQFFVNNEADYPERVERGSDGAILSVDNSPMNLYKYVTSSWDLSATYQKDTSWGTFNFYAQGTRVRNFQYQYNLNQPLVEYVGFPYEGGMARHRGNFELTWERQGLKLGWATEYVGSYNVAWSAGSPFWIVNFNLPAGQPAVHAASLGGGTTIPNFMTHSLMGSYTFDNSPVRNWKQGLLSNLQVNVTVKNVFDRAPNFDPAYAPYYLSPYGDTRLRSVNLTVRKGF